MNTEKFVTPSREKQLSGEESRVEHLEASLEKERQELARHMGALEGVLAKTSLKNVAKSLASMPSRKKSFYTTWMTVISMVAIYGGAQKGREYLEENNPEVLDQIHEALSGGFGEVEDVPGEIEPGGEGAFSKENVEEQREWLRRWISERETRPDDASHSKERSLALLKRMRVAYNGLGPAAGKVHHYGDRRIELDPKDAHDPSLKNVPVHELTHAAMKGQVLIGEKERAIIREVTKSSKEYQKVSEAFQEKSGGDLLLPNYEYITSPSEFKAFLMGARKAMNLEPNQVVDDQMVDDLFERHEKGEIEDVQLNRIIDVIKDKEAFKRAFSELS